MNVEPNKNISILGCGWLGLPLAINLIQKGYTLAGSTTSPSKLAELESNNIQPYLIDIHNIDEQLSDFLSSNTLIVAITSKNVEAVKELIQHIEQSPVQNVLFISSTSVYPNTNSVVTEATPTIDLPLAAIEQLFYKNTNFNTTILRFGGLFGYDRKPGNFFKTDKPIDNPEGYINFIHRDDCIAIIEQIIQQNAWNEILNACADEHPTRRAFYTREFQKVDKPIPVFNESAENQYKIIDSQKMKSLLNYKFKYGELIKF